jgi:hypothetical protein
VRGVLEAVAVRAEGRPRALERRVDLDPTRRFEVGVGFENHTSHPAPGEILLYPGGYSETEILLPYGGCMFSSIVGQLAGNHFLTVFEGNENLRPLGEMTLWQGAQDIVFAHE